MNGRRMGAAVGAAVVLALVASPAWATFTRPWDDLSADPSANWIAGDSISMYAANTSTAYPVSFNPVNKGKASGMSVLWFAQPNVSAHHVSSDLAGSVDVLATGNKAFGTVLVVVAVDAASLGGDFGLTLNGAACDATDFVSYDSAGHAAGRPSGYYPGGTTPAGEPLAYNFDAGMVTVLAFEGVALDKTTSYALDYSFQNLPGRAVFSVYAQPTGEAIHHTNAGVLGSGVSSYSTFMVPEPASLGLLACGAVALLRRRRDLRA